MSDASEILRRAATVLREHAEAATEGRWQARVHGSRQDCRVVKSGEEYVTLYAQDHNADFIALVDPTVGLALADWLSNCADRWPYSDRHTPEQAHALAVARAILRETP